MAEPVKARTASARWRVNAVARREQITGVSTHLICAFHGAVAAIHTLRLDVTSKHVDLLHTCRFFRLLTTLLFLQRHKMMQGLA